MDKDGDAGLGRDGEVLRAFLDALTRIVPREEAASVLEAWSRAPELHLTELLRNAPRGGRERPAAPAGPPADCDAPTAPDEEATQVDPLATSPFPAASTEAEPPSIAPEPVDGRPSPPLPKESRSERYELIKVHARGGIGQVWRARDRQLQREVAVKELQPKNADRDDLRARFLVEAEITGRLEHPGIVPVYSFGEDETGRPYYAMRFVRGHSLTRAIREFHRGRREAEARGTDPALAWGLDFRLLLKRFVGACETLEYAHSQGCIHRDLKPGNIMVGPYGETLVVDWGLGKVMGSGPETPPPSPPTPAEDLPRWTPSSGTSPGDRIGTPQYMSPEQAMGALDRIGPRSDVYSLGATLHELLTGEVPFDGPDQHGVVVSVLRGASPPRATLPSIPAPLEAACLRAMAFKPEDRYPSAAALARDLENWLADEPVSAHPERRRERLARWVRRHRSWATAAAVVLVAVSLTATGAAVAINRSWRNESAARGLAEEGQGMAQGAVDDYLIKVSQGVLQAREDSLDMRILRRDLLTTALGYYENLSARRRDDPELKWRLARAYEGLGFVEKEISTSSDALTHLKAALGLWDELRKMAPDDDGLAAERSWTLIGLGDVLKAQGKRDEALATLADAASTMEACVNKPDASPQRTIALADCYSTMSTVQAGLGMPEESIRSLDRARELLRRRLSVAADDVAARSSLAVVANARGSAEYQRGDSAAALQAFRESGEMARVLLDGVKPGNPPPIRLVEMMGVSDYNIGNILANAGRDQEAAAAYTRALKTWGPLAEAHPTVLRYREYLGLVLREFGFLQYGEGREQEALGTLGRALEAFEALARLEPGRATTHHHLARTWNKIGCIHDDRRDHRAAAETFRRSVDESRLALDAGPRDPTYVHHLALCLANLAEQPADQGDVASARAAWDDAAAVALKGMQAPEARTIDFVKLGGVATTSAWIRLQAGDPAGASARLDEVSAAIRNARTVPSPAAREDALENLNGLRAAILIAQGRPEDAVSVLDPARRRLEARLASGESSARDPLSNVLGLLAAARRRLGLDGPAAEAASARDALWKPGEAPSLIAAASRKATRSCLFGYGRTPLADPRGEAARALDAELVAEEVRLALSLGLVDRARLRGDAALMTALDRPGYRDLRDGIAFPDLPFEPTEAKSTSAR